MRDLLESNVISIGSSSAPGKSACRFLLLPPRGCVRLPAPCSQLQGCSSSRVPEPEMRNWCYSSATSISLCPQQPQEKWDRAVPPRASARLCCWQESASSGDVATSWQRAPEGPASGVEVSQVLRVGQSLWWLRELLCQATPGHCDLGREIISGFSPWLVDSSWLEEPRKGRGAPQQGLP